MRFVLFKRGLSTAFLFLSPPLHPARGFSRFLHTPLPSQCYLALACRRREKQRGLSPASTTARQMTMVLAALSSTTSTQVSPLLKLLNGLWRLQNRCPQCRRPRQRQLHREGGEHPPLRHYWARGGADLRRATPESSLASHRVAIVLVVVVRLQLLRQGVDDAHRFHRECSPPRLVARRRRVDAQHSAEAKRSCLRAVWNSIPSIPYQKALGTKDSSATNERIGAVKLKPLSQSRARTLALLLLAEYSTCRYASVRTTKTCVEFYELPHSWRLVQKNHEKKPRRARTSTIMMIEPMRTSAIIFWRFFFCVSIAFVK